MSKSSAATRRPVAELLIGSGLVVACGTVTVLGLATWAVTLLQAAYPCGETYQVHPSCRLRDPDEVALGRLLMLAVPALCTLGAVVAGTVTFVRWRRAALPAAVAFAIALMAFLAGRTMLLAALGDVVPW